MPDPLVGAPPANQPVAPAQRPRRRWLWWLVGLGLLALAFVALLPTILSIPACRDKLLNWFFAPRDVHISISDASFGWFSPVVASGIVATAEGPSPASVSIDELRSDTSLWSLIFGPRLGTYQVVHPQVNVEFEPGSDNLIRLLAALQGVRINRPATLEISDASLAIRRKNAPEPWRVDGLNINLQFTPAGSDPPGAPMVRGQDITLLNHAKLTPEMCNDFLKYVAPVLARATDASGEISLTLDELKWPIGMPDKAELKGRLTLHEVTALPGQKFQELPKMIGLESMPDSIRLVKDDVVTFSMHDGRVYHENLEFGLADAPIDRLVRTHGSVGIDETLDVFVQLPPMGAKILPEGPLRDALSQQSVTVRVVGTLSAPVVKLPMQEGQIGPAVQGLSEFLKRRAEARGTQPGAGSLFNRRRPGAATAPAESGKK